MLKWLSRSATVLLMLFSAQSFAINAQDPYSLVKDAAGKIDVNADMSAITSEKTDAFYDGDEIYRQMEVSVLLILLA